MPGGSKTAATLLLAGLVLGVLLATRHEIFPPVEKPVALSASPLGSWPGADHYLEACFPISATVAAGARSGETCGVDDLSFTP
jgi:hypothetical protein